MPEKKDAYMQEIKDARKRAMAMKRCCATCQNLADDGLCTQFNSYPPLDEIETFVCEHWLPYVPF